MGSANMALHIVSEHGPRTKRLRTRTYYSCGETVSLVNSIFSTNTLFKLEPPRFSLLRVDSDSWLHIRPLAPSDWRWRQRRAHPMAIRNCKTQDGGPLGDPAFSSRSTRRNRQWDRINYVHRLKTHLSRRQCVEATDSADTPAHKIPR